MVKVEVLQKRIQKAEEYLHYLEETKEEYNRQEFKEDPKIFGSKSR
ncbi:MAG: hypothetical protein ACOC2J_03470 [bacterium]